MYLIIALSIIVFSVLTVTTRKILRSATFLLSPYLPLRRSTSSSTMSFSEQSRSPFMPVAL